MVKYKTYFDINDCLVQWLGHNAHKPSKRTRRKKNHTTQKRAKEKNIDSQQENENNKTSKTEEFSIS